MRLLARGLPHVRVLAWLLVALPAAGAEPLLVVISAGQAGLDPWNKTGWRVVSYSGPAAWTDHGVKALEALVRESESRSTVDPARVYLAGEGDAVPGVFYAASRRPDLWTAAVALGGNPGPAIATNRLFGANTQLVPVLWLAPPEFEPLRQKLRVAGFNLASTTSGDWADWLAAQRRDLPPFKVDCETGSLEFARCYWVEITRFDPAQRNDVLETTRVPPGSGAALALGGFGFRFDEPGPGVLVSWLPENYRGPLKVGDRIVALGGVAIRDARHYLELMEQMREPRRIAVMIQRGRERLRQETSVVLPKREEIFTARVQAEFFPQQRDLEVLSRGVGELRLHLSDRLAPAKIVWNGLDAGLAGGPGCWVLSASVPARSCP